MYFRDSHFTTNWHIQPTQPRPWKKKTWCKTLNRHSKPQSTKRCLKTAMVIRLTEGPSTANQHLWVVEVMKWPGQGLQKTSTPTTCLEIEYIIVVWSPNPMASKKHDFPKGQTANLGVTRPFFWQHCSKQFLVTNSFMFWWQTPPCWLYPTLVVCDIFDILISLISHCIQWHIIVPTWYRPCTHHIPTLYPHVAHHCWWDCNYWVDDITSTFGGLIAAVGSTAMFDDFVGQRLNFRWCAVERFPTDRGFLK